MGNIYFQTIFPKQMATPEEQAIQGVIDQIWDTYDVDKSGALDKQETKKFVQDTLGNLGSGDEFSDEAFDEVFATFDKDGSGTVEKSEMVVFQATPRTMSMSETGCYLSYVTMSSRHYG